MTYQFLQNVTTGYLIGDNKLPADPDILLALVASALTTTATLADSLHLMTLSTTADILRLAQGDYLIRRPQLPVLLTDPMDIDDELGYAVARYIASMISKGNNAMHASIAERMILDYNAKVYEIIHQMQAEAEAEGITNFATTEFTL